MSNSTPKDENETLTFAEYLETSPPNSEAIISDLTVRKSSSGGARVCLKTPDLLLHCPEDSCNGIRFYRCIKGHDSILGEDECNAFFLNYRCSNCQKTIKTYSLSAQRNGVSFSGRLYKFGEHPVFGPQTPARLLKLIGPDRDAFLKGRRCENQGLGIGAFVYYRRVVENQKNRILREIIKVLTRIEAPQEKVQILEDAINESQFSKSLELAKSATPEILLIDGHSPLKLLHSALSEGIHNMSDEECLGIASSIRVVLSELSERLSQALKDEAELTHAISRLLHHKPQKSIDSK